MAYTLSANICDGNDYVAHWDGGTYDDYETAFLHYVTWMPPRHEIEAVLDEYRALGNDLSEFDLQIGVWDEDGNDVLFWSEGVE